MRASRRAGFSAVEVLVALALSGVVIAGAFVLQSTFNTQAQRQSQVADVQQTLRIAMSILGRALRSAGAGMVGGQMSLKTCSGTQALYGFRFANLNAYPQTVLDSTAGGNDTDPDWFRVIAAESDGNLARSDSGVAAVTLGSLTSWAARDLMLIIKPGMLTPNHCLREVTNAAFGVLEHATASMQYPCANNVPDCTTGTTWPVPVRRFRNEVTYRVIPGTGLDAPRLAMRRARIGDAAASVCDWETIVEDIEDMQIALILSNGQVCNSVDDPALCDPALAVAVRLTLVARGPTPAGGPLRGSVGGYEDRAAVAVQDGYVRRALTAEIQLRN